MNRIAIAQMQSTPDMDRNLDHALKYIQEAVDHQADLIAFPETFLLRGNNNLYIKKSESIGGPTVDIFKQQAVKHRISILMGSICETNTDSTDKVFNTSILIDKEGETIAVYRKIHLFSIFTSDVTIDESQLFTPGCEIVTCKHEIGRVGLTICYDLRFPTLFQKLTAEGAQIIFVPSAFTVPTGRAHWLTLLKARAIENQVYIVAPAQYGKHTENLESFGKSVVFDPWGKMLALAPDKPGLIYSDIDLKFVKDTNDRLPVHRHKIKDIDY